MPDTALPTLSLVDMVLPEQCNHHGTLFGGAALAMLDKLAYILASKLMRGPIVTAAVHDIEFRTPAPAGWLTECTGRIQHLGRRSITIDARLYAEDLISAERRHCLSGRFVMVASERAVVMPPVTLQHAADAVCVAEIVFPGHANHRGILHGGPAMAWLAKAGFAAATRHTRQQLVMAASERLDFHAPARVGDVVEITARVIKTGRTSLTVEAHMNAESPGTGERHCCTTATLVFVTIDDNGRPAPLRRRVTDT